MQRLFALLSEIAPTDSTVLIEGETGTGKELVAEEIHRHSKRAAGPFVIFHCSAVAKKLLESKLFGHVKGAFGDAVTDRQGAFAEANGGTIFLDEIGELAHDLQPALLRVLDRRAVRRVGASAYEQVDVRVIAATNRNLREEMAHRMFREELYYRLAVIRVHLPPLRERAEDIELLAQTFVEQFAPAHRLSIPPADMQRLREHRWPGNVRELRNVIERACVLSKGSSLHIAEALDDAGSFPLSTSVYAGLAFRAAREPVLEQFECEYITDLMSRHQTNLSAAAREAQIDRKHLRELLRKYGIERGHDGS